MTLLILFFCVSILVSFLCSIWEAVLLSITPSYTQVQLEKGGTIGTLLKSFKDNIDRPLGAILTLNTIAHTVGAIGVGAQATIIFRDSPFQISLGFITISPEAIAAVVMTLAILILSEIIPKTIGANYWQTLTPFTVKSLRLIIILLWPLVYLSQLITRSVKSDETISVFNRADFTAMTELGAKEGVFAEHESKFIHNLLSFHTIQAKDIMTPRTVIKIASEKTTIREFYDSNKNLRFSRIPLYQETRDHITGYFLKDHLLAALVEDRNDDKLSTIRREIIAVNESFPIPELFNHFIERSEHLALVVDDFGGTSGIVTMEDVIETLLGMEIVDEQDGTEDMQMLARKQWESRAKNLGLLEESAKNQDLDQELDRERDGGHVADQEQTDHQYPDAESEQSPGSLRHNKPAG